MGAERGINLGGLSYYEILEIHKFQITRYGGSPGLRNIELLESAVYIPQASFGGKFLHASLLDMAAAYAFHISENQPFVDGNKRTGLASALTFLEINSISINDPKGKLYEAMVKVSTVEK